MAEGSSPRSSAPLDVALEHTQPAPLTPEAPPEARLVVRLLGSAASPRLWSVQLTSASGDWIGTDAA